MKDKHYTLKEIEQQPELWTEVFDIIKLQSNKIADFIKASLENQESEIIFTGAGSSFFIAEIVAAKFQKNIGISTKAVSTTEIVTHPSYHINRKKHTLMVSFARSGNSPESLASVEIASAFAPNIHHLFISCNAEGALAKKPKTDHSYLILLPEETNDKSLAMTSSVTSMALVALLIGQLNKIETLDQNIKQAAELTDKMLQNFSSDLQEIAQIDFNRAVFLGSGPMQGVAREAHLKLQELTDGKVISKFDSFLGFRHGPKAVVDKKTLMVYFFSNDDYVRKYEKDLVNSMKESSSPIYSLGIIDKEFPGLVLEKEIHFGYSDSPIEESFWMMSSLVVIQLLAFYKSLALGFNPDSPSTNGSIHRVVQGVNIYQHSHQKEGQK